MRRLATTAAFAAVALLAAIPAQAQLNGAHLLGDFGVNSGTQLRRAST
jgi:hypothetical protein